jgi:hypothetical protein
MDAVLTCKKHFRRKQPMERRSPNGGRLMIAIFEHGEVRRSET